MRDQQLRGSQAKEAGRVTLTHTESTRDLATTSSAVWLLRTHAAIVHSGGAGWRDSARSEARVGATRGGAGVELAQAFPRTFQEECSKLPRAGPCWRDSHLRVRRVEPAALPWLGLYRPMRGFCGGCTHSMLARLMLASAKSQARAVLVCTFTAIAHECNSFCWEGESPRTPRI